MPDSRPTGARRTERGLTEVLGYLLIFSVVVLTVALVTVSGQAGLTDLRDSQRTANVESGFVILADNVDDVLRDGVPSRATELDLSGGSLSLGPPIEYSITASNASGTVLAQSRTIRPIVYRAPDGAALIYSSGGVIVRGEDGGTAMLREPPAVLSTNRTLVPIANTTLNRRQLRGGADYVDGESRVLVRTERRGLPTVASVENEVTVELTISSPRAPVWASYFEDAIDSDPGCSVSDNVTSCTYTTDSVTAVLTEVAVSFE